ncbi:MAG TPA: hypothetical protein VNE62_08615 [Actinomycetota bacterium]|nr:hypothetical protein [Actinomycetota bacterium]
MICATPMVVWRSHGFPDQATEQRMVQQLERVADAVYGQGGWWTDGRMRNIPDHWHRHARPAGGFFGPRR